MLVRGAMPGRAVIAGQGLREVLGTGGGAGAHLRRVIDGLGTFEPGSPDYRTEQWLKSSNVDPIALVLALGTVIPTPVEAVRLIQVPALVAIGADDERAVSADDLVAVLPHGTLQVVPGNHATAGASPELTAAIGDFLG
jgi:hypothetical protein